MTNSIEILLVEDNPGDVRLTREALRDSKVINHISVVDDGVKAMEFLQRLAPYQNAPRPDMILLDLNLPRRSGREVLADIKLSDDFRRIPVVILTTSDDEQDILNSYDLHANCFITKPVDFDRFITIVKSIESFWFSIVKLPHE